MIVILSRVRTRVKIERVGKNIIPVNIRDKTCMNLGVKMFSQK